MFKAAQTYILTNIWDSADAFSKQLERLQLQHCGAADMETKGFVAPCSHSTHQLVHSIGGQWLFCFGVESRILPSCVVNQACADRAAEIEEQQGFKPGRKQLKELKETITLELLPKAFTRQKYTAAWFDPSAGILTIFASSRTAAEPMIEAMHKALDELPLKLVNTQVSPGAAMTDWVSGGEAPGAFSIDEDCELHAIDDEAKRIRYTNHELDGNDIREHIAAGKQVTKLGLTYNDRVSFVLTDRLELKAITLLDTTKEDSEQADQKGKEEEFDASFALFTGEMRRVFPALFDALGGEIKTI